MSGRPGLWNADYADALAMRSAGQFASGSVAAQSSRDVQDKRQASYGKCDSITSQWLGSRDQRGAEQDVIVLRNVVQYDAPVVQSKFAKGKVAKLK